MKKISSIVFAVILIAAFALPASALENTFGGYWRTWFLYYDGMTGNDNDESLDDRMIESRTRLYYTAKINDNLSFINKFEFDDYWGNRSKESYLDYGTDGIGVEVKNSYIDANALGGNWKIGAQYFGLARGILFDDDAVGLKAIYKVGEGVILPFIWVRLNEGFNSWTRPGAPDVYPADKGANTGELNEQDTDILVFAPKIYFSKEMSINPYFVWLTSQDFTAGTDLDPFDNVEAFALGIDFDAEFDAFSFWFTGIYEFGSGRMVRDLDMDGNGVAETFIDQDYDISAFGGIIGGSGTFGNVKITGELGYATGDDPTEDDKEINQFFSTYGWWDYGEILSGTYCGWEVPNGSPGGDLTNIMYGRLAVNVKINDAWSLDTTFVYAELDEPWAAGGDTDLGFDLGFDLKWQVIEGLAWDFYGGYLLAGDAVNGGYDDKCDPWSLSTRLSLSF
jgi:hypothetical protein